MTLHSDDCNLFGSVFLCIEIGIFLLFFCILALAFYTQWSEWGACDQDCKGGVKRRTRSCSDVNQANRGNDCGPELEETLECENLPDCVGKNSTVTHVYIHSCFSPEKSHNNKK